MPTREKNKLRRDIVAKFGSLINFYRVSGIKYRKLTLYLSSDIKDVAYHQRIRHEIDQHYIANIPGTIIEDNREIIRQCIAVNFKSYAEFNRKYKGLGFDSNYLSNLINGKLKDETLKYRKLIKILKRDYDIDLW